MRFVVIVHAWRNVSLCRLPCCLLVLLSCLFALTGPLHDPDDAIPCDGVPKNPGVFLRGWLRTHPISMLKDMTELSTGQSIHGAVNYTSSAYTELQEVLRPQGGDMV